MITIDFGIGISIGGTIGFIIREIIGDRMARDRALETIRITEFNKAASTFRVAFVNEIFLLQENIKMGTKMPDEIIYPNILIAHEKAKIIFEPFVSSTELESFNKAWENYKNCENTYYPKHMGSYKAEKSKFYLDHINHLLQHAKPKI